MRDGRAAGVSGRSQQLYPEVAADGALRASRQPRAQQMGYTRKIAEEFEKQDLPPQFFYLAMQESGFDEVASGPPTRMGIAKGMWQFIPETADALRADVGPLAAFRRPDPPTIGTTGKKRRTPRPPTSRISIRPMRRRQACW